MRRCLVHGLRKRELFLALLAGALWTVLSADPVTLDDLRKDPKLTPQRFARYFADFDYEYREPIKPPDEFLAERKGDCDDYATLAYGLLGEKGHHVHLVIVRMPGINHVVCYVDEIKGYLDYNLRIYSKRTNSCKRSLRKIAEEVADSMSANWTSASEFTYLDGVKYLVSTITKANPAAVLKVETIKVPEGHPKEFEPLQP